MFQEIAYQDPLQIFSLFAEKNGALFLDSAQLKQHCGRYSCIALDPFLFLESKNGLVSLNQQILHAEPLTILAQQLARFSQQHIADLPFFQGGAAGFWSYDLAQHLEKLPRAKKDDMQFPDMAVGFYDLVIGFDELTKRAWIFSSGFPEQDLVKREQRALERFNWLSSQLVFLPNYRPLRRRYFLKKIFRVISPQKSIKMQCKKS